MPAMAVKTSTTTGRQSDPANCKNSRPIFEHLSRLSYGSLRFEAAHDNVIPSPNTVVYGGNNSLGHLPWPPGPDVHYDATGDVPYVIVPSKYVSNENHALLKILRLLGLPCLPSALIQLASIEYMLQHDRKQQQVARDWLLGALQAAQGMNAWVLSQHASHQNAELAMLEDSILRNVPILGLSTFDITSDWARSLLQAAIPWTRETHQTVTVTAYKGFDDGSSGSSSMDLPCPGMSHYLFFEDAHDIDLFRNALLEAIPNVLLVLGRPTLPCTVLSHVAKGLPAIIIRNDQTKSLCRLLEHIDVQACRRRETEMECDSKVFEVPPPRCYRDKKILALLDCWPTSYDSESILLVESSELNAERIQEYFDMAIQSFSVKDARVGAIKHAQALLHILYLSPKIRIRDRDIRHYQQLMATLAAVILSVVYAEHFVENTETSTMQLLLYAGTILLPLYLCLVQGKPHVKKYLDSYEICQRAAVNLESEVLKFQSRVGNYRSGTPGESYVGAFNDKVDRIWSCAESYHGAGEHASLLDETVLTASSSAEHDIESPSLDETTPLVPKHAKETQMYTTELVRYPNADACVSSLLIGDQNPTSDFLPVIILTGSRYTRTRMRRELETMQTELHKLAICNALSANAIKVATASTTVLAMLSLHWVIPVILSVATSIASERDHQSFERRISLLSRSTQRLENLDTWWSGLLLDDRCDAGNLERLVMEAEAIIVEQQCSSLDGELPVDDIHAHFSWPGLPNIGASSPVRTDLPVFTPERNAANTSSAARRERARQVGNAVTNHVHDMDMLSDKVKAISEQVNGLVNSYTFHDDDLPEVE